MKKNKRNQRKFLHNKERASNIESAQAAKLFVKRLIKLVSTLGFLSKDIKDGL